MSVLCKGVGAVRGFDRWSHEKGLNAFSLCSVRCMYCREAAPLQLVNSGIPDLSNFIKMIWFSELIHEWLCVIRSQWWALRCTQINLLYSYENIFLNSLHSYDFPLIKESKYLQINEYQQANSYNHYNVQTHSAWIPVEHLLSIVTVISQCLWRLDIFRAFSYSNLSQVVPDSWQWQGK